MGKITLTRNKTVPNLSSVILKIIRKRFISYYYNYYNLGHPSSLIFLSASRYLFCSKCNLIDCANFEIERY